MTPRRYAIGLTVTLTATIAFYTWLSLRILRLPPEWVIPIMAGVTVILAVSSFHGYRRWLSRQAVTPIPIDSAARNGTSTVTVVSFMLAVATTAWAAGYFLWQGFLIAGLAMGIGAGALALWSIRYLIARSALGARPIAAEGVFDLRALRTILVVINAAILLGIGIALLWPGLGGLMTLVLVLVLMSAILLLLGMLKIRRDSSRPR